MLPVSVWDLPFMLGGNTHHVGPCFVIYLFNIPTVGKLNAKDVNNK
jgi:hypothetical protein